MIESLTQALVDQAQSIIAEVEQMGGMVRAVDAGFPQRLVQSAAAERQARLESGQDIVVGVNRYRPEAGSDAPIELRSVDNHAVREQQLRRLAALKAGRDAKRVEQLLARLSQAARQGTDNLLALTIDAMRARATVGEAAEALVRVWGRYQASTEPVHQVYGRLRSGDEQWEGMKERVLSFERRAGRRPRILIVKLGQDGHDRGSRVVASAFADMGFDVDLGPLFQTPEEAARQAVENDVHIVGASSQAGAHVTLVPQLIEELKKQGADDVLVVCGGIIPEQDRGALSEAGVAAIFGTETDITEAAGRLLDLIEGASKAQ